MDFEKETELILKWVKPPPGDAVIKYVKEYVRYIYGKGKLDAGEEIKQIILKQPQK